MLNTCRFLQSLSAQSDGLCKHRWRNRWTPIRLGHTQEPFSPCVNTFLTTVFVFHFWPTYSSFLLKYKQPFIRVSRSWIVFHDWQTRGYRFVFEALCGGKIAHLSVAFSLFCNYLYSPITSSDKFLWFMTDTRTLRELLSEYPVWVLELCLVSLKKMSLRRFLHLNPKWLNFLTYVFNWSAVSSWDYNRSDIFKTPELIPSARQFPSPFKSPPQRGSSCRKDLTFPRIVPAVNDRFRKEARKWPKKKREKNHSFDARHDKWIERKRD